MAEPMEQIIDGNEVAQKEPDEVKAGVEAFRRAHGRAPGLHVVLVGDDQASAVYVRNKEKAAEEVGMAGKVYRLAAPDDGGRAGDDRRVLHRGRAGGGARPALHAGPALDG